METQPRDGFGGLWRSCVRPNLSMPPSPSQISSFLATDSDSSAADEISGETVAIKMVTRVFEKVSLAKRALRELALLRHFNNHENITGLIDVDAIAPGFNEM